MSRGYARRWGMGRIRRATCYQPGSTGYQDAMRGRIGGQFAGGSELFISVATSTSAGTAEWYIQQRLDATLNFMGSRQWRHGSVNCGD